MPQQLYIIDNRIFIYLDALLADFSIEISDIKNCRWQDGISLGTPNCHRPIADRLTPITNFQYLKLVICFLHRIVQNIKSVVVMDGVTELDK